MENPTETLNIFINKLIKESRCGEVCYVEQNKQLGTVVSKALQNRQWKIMRDGAMVPGQPRSVCASVYIYKQLGERNYSHNYRQEN